MTGAGGSRPLSLTYVRYEDGDVLGLVFAVASLLPMAVIVSLVTLVAFRRDVRTISLLNGLVANEVLNAVLKNIIREPRPRGTDRSDHGMPSSHAQFMGFLAIYLALAVVLRFRIGRWYVKVLLAAVVTASAVAVCWSRVYLGYHTVHQVAVGACVGTVLACIWFFFVEWIGFSFIWPRLRNTKIARMFLLRDYFIVGDSIAYEYRNAINSYSQERPKAL